MADPWAGFQQVGTSPRDQWAGFSQVKPAPASEAETQNLADTKDEGFGNLMMMGDDQIDGMKAWAPVVGGMVAGPVAGAVSDAAPMAGGLMKALGNPYVAGGLSAAGKLITTGSIPAALAAGFKAGGEAALGGKILGLAGAGGGLLSRLRGVSAVASVAPAIAEATKGLESAAAPLVEAAAPVARAYQGIPSLMNIAGTGAEDAAGAVQAARAAQGARGAASIADMVQPAAQGVSAAKDLSGTGGGAAGYVAGLIEDKAAPAAASGAESLLETRLRASVLAKQNPQALRDEIVEKVRSLKEGVGKGLSAAQVGTSIEDLYGLGKSQAHNMAKAIFSAMGYE